MNRQLSKLYKWGGEVYRVDLDAPAGERVLVKEGDNFISKPDLGRLGISILFEGIPIKEDPTDPKKNFLKRRFGLIILTIFLISIDIYWNELFFTLFLFYGLFIKLLLSKYVEGKIKKILTIIIWTTFTIILGLTFYTNYYLPHGPSYPTGEIICQNDDRGPCDEEYREDTSKLNIPEWAKFLRSSAGWLSIIGLLFAGIVLSNKDKND